ncbi:F0F1 ATP synthase subunit delta [Agarivorans aestuarii]|jgi:F-type H+-transporting ATPase subunit delta|uniref:ATP synthase subunit delta n=1 Tax=Agarivorans aestuarii TaxID=1563703 RepID=A0ABU7GAL4_9ALTE|nr:MULTISPECIES: F0F1 ATP synthase subunit delta [Agarivorans]MEE1676144.1 F0F1 ATP synthase subunit delta [Agarivorans aestuarii]
MADLTTIARPYAKAAFDFAVEHKALDEWTEMLAFVAEVAANEHVSVQLKKESATTLVNLFTTVCAEQLNEHGLNLIKLMAENARLDALPAVLALFLEYKAELAKEITADVVSASELDAAQQAQISASLEQRLSRKVKLNCSVDASLMAGVIIHAGDLVIDSSVKGQLAKLSDALQA